LSASLRSIDTIPHEGVTDVAGHAIRALGTAIGVCYRKENKKL
jgi:hypothetical protein